MIKLSPVREEMIGTMYHNSSVSTIILLSYFLGLLPKNPMDTLVKEHA